MRRQFAILVVIVGLVAACGGGATPTPVPTDRAYPCPDGRLRSDARARP